MVYSTQQLREIYDKTEGYCAICDKKLALTNHGMECEKGSWEADHGNPVSRGGVDDLRNLQPLCYPCNRQKSNMTTNEFNRWIDRKYNTIDSYQQAMLRKHC